MPEPLSTLIRLAEVEVDRQKRYLSEVMERSDALERCRRDLDRETLEEQRTAAAHPLAADYGTWAVAANERRRTLDGEIDAAQQDVAKAVESVGEAWRRQRSLELAREARDRRGAAAAQRAIQAALDEQALDRHRRRNG